MFHATLLKSLGFTALAGLSALAQPAAPKAPQPPAAGAPPAPAPAAAEPARTITYVTNREFKSRLFILKHAAPFALKLLLKPLASGFAGSEITCVDENGLNALSVRDFPENLAVIEEALKRLDQPSAVENPMEFRIYVLYALRQADRGAAIPEDLSEVLAALKGTLAFKSYILAATSTLRIAAAPGCAQVTGGGQGEAVLPATRKEPPTLTTNYTWSMFRPSIKDGRLETSAFDFRGSESDGSTRSDTLNLHTSLSLRDGEKVVLGSTTLKNRGVILVVTARSVK